MGPSEDVFTLEIKCRNAGLRLTPNLSAVISALVVTNEHPNIDELHAAVAAKGRRVPIASLYRTVANLVSIGLVVERHFGRGKARYELADRSAHDHLIDVSTGQILEFHNEELDALEAKIAARMGYKIVRRSLRLYAEPLSSS